jgi:hypothetical protein
MIIGRGNLLQYHLVLLKSHIVFPTKRTVLSVKTGLFIYCGKRLLVLARDCTGSNHGSVCRSKMDMFTVVWFEMSQSCRCYITQHRGT